MINQLFEISKMCLKKSCWKTKETNASSPSSSSINPKDCLDCNNDEKQQHQQQDINIKCSNNNHKDNLVIPNSFKSYHQTLNFNPSLEIDTHTTTSSTTTTTTSSSSSSSLLSSLATTTATNNIINNNIINNNIINNNSNSHLVSVSHPHSILNSFNFIPQQSQLIIQKPINNNITNNLNNLNNILNVKDKIIKDVIEKNSLDNNIVVGIDVKNLSPDRSININQLPTLILKQILSYVHGGRFPTYLSITMNRVCKLWWETVVSTLRSFIMVEMWMECKDQEISNWCKQVSAWLDRAFGDSETRKRRRCCLDLVQLKLGFTSVMIQPILVKLSSYCHMVDLDLSGNRIDDDGAEMIADTLMPQLSALNLAFNRVSDRGALAIARKMGGNTTIRKLILAGNCFGRPTMKEMICILAQHNFTLCELDVSGALVSDAMENLSTLPRDPPPHLSSLTKLSIASTASGRYMEFLFNCRNIANYLVELDISDNGVQPPACKWIALALMRPECLLQALILDNNAIGDVGLYELCKMVPINRTLRKLSLVNNRITYSGVSHLCHALSDPDASMEELDLSNNQLKPIAAPYLSFLFGSQSRNLHLATLKLRYCQLDDTGSQQLLRALITNTSIRTIDLNGNNIQQPSCLVVAKLLLSNTHLRSLRLGNNSIDNQGAAHIAAAIRGNKTLTHLDLENNAITYSGALPLIESLQINTTLIDLNLYIISIPRNLRLFLRTSQ